MLRPRVLSKEAVEVIPFQQCPAKTFVDEQGVSLGRSVPEHCQIVGEVAKALIARQPASLRECLYPQGAHLVAAAHDIGKVSPTFYEKLRRACTVSIAGLPALKQINPQLESSWGGHAGVSQVTTKALQVPTLIPEILGQHHGFSPPVAGLRANDENFGGPPWQQERERLVAFLKSALQADWPQIASLPQARLLAGLTSVADWIGSGEFFEDPSLSWTESIDKALDSAGFIPPTFRSGLSFEAVFGFAPRPAQQLLIEQVDGPGVYVLEAPMGVGKTEAALYAAYQLMHTGQANGIYFALPTQLTSNKIYDRFNSFLQQVLAPDCSHRSLLLHANAWLLETDMGEEGRPGGAWFNQAKRGLLAPFAVGTIDQALMAAMNVKHGFVRAFGLAGKVVILDEVHTYDAYTGTLLDALVALLRELHCSVIILSATLNQSRRQQVLGCTLTASEYPLITACPTGKTVREVPVASDPGNVVNILLQSDEKYAVEEALRRAVQGQQVLWIENTVPEAQQRFLDLAARGSEQGVTCGLLHSRFTPQHRQQKEALWVECYGKQGHADRGAHGRILVGTQVLEQSLDIDADFLVTRFAPTDMLLQRFGRLWRHADTPRPAGSVCEAWLLAPMLETAIDQPEQGFGNSAFVYSSYVLCRSLEVWQSREHVRLPEQIRELIEQTYCERAETGPMARWLMELNEGTRWRKGRKSLSQLARVTLSDSGKTLPEIKAQTRYSETDNLDVLLLRKLDWCPKQQLTRLTLLNGQSLDLPRSRTELSRRQWRELSAALMRQVVSVRIQDAPLPLQLKTLNDFNLQHCFYLGNPAMDEALLRVALVDETGRLQGVQGAPLHDRYDLEYRDDLGYRIIKH
ncbi:CRISPR-associated helicase Cas3' [Pseudomonas saliphila]|uniref:CRISPR-associated helicase Cas3' n=1 Tax=Pseudomonas saliphila TaxID=2586906 RepID=UPI001239428D|nr:CRISPR-associated helicase Cas3' [Pseudomonas saliphila]